MVLDMPFNSLGLGFLFCKIKLIETFQMELLALERMFVECFAHSS